MKFQEQIQEFNSMYRLPISSTPNLTEVGDPVKRLLQFNKILRDELTEVDDIIAGINENRDPSDTLTDLGDWLGDIIVFAASEAKRFGIDIMPVVTEAIMASNFSKLGADGKPIYDADMKVQKGPGYYKPEPAIKELICAARGEAYSAYKPYVSSK